jgi:hypothetical protein
VSLNLVFGFYTHRNNHVRIITIDLLDIRTPSIMTVFSVIEAWTAPDQLPFTGAVVAALVAIVAIPILYRLLSDPMAAFPFHGLEIGNESQRRAAFMVGASRLYAEGYRKFADRAFRMTIGLCKSKQPTSPPLSEPPVWVVLSQPAHGLFLTNPYSRACHLRSSQVSARAAQTG